MKGYLSTLDSLQSEGGLASSLEPDDLDSKPLRKPFVSFADIQLQSKDVFIIADVSQPDQLENYSVAEVFSIGRDLIAEAAAPRMLMGKVKLEEVGTTWSPAERPATASTQSGVNFRPLAIADDSQERPLTYKLQWRQEPTERPLTYKLQWWTEAAQRPLTYKLQWFADQDELWFDGQYAVPPALPYELRWRK
jgi:hypothetical protein